MIWKPISEYEGIYEVSSNGSIRTVEGKETFTKHHGKRLWKQRILKQKTDKGGYKRVSLYKEGKPKDFLVHRLVANEFCVKPEGKNLVNHIDGNPSNNDYTNLEWCTSKENVNHAFENGLMTTQKSVKLISKATGEETVFYSLAQASEFMGKNKGYVSCVLKRGKTETKHYIINKIGVGAGQTG